MWKNRIVKRANVDPKELNPNPLNWRTHSQSQREAMQTVLSDIGFVQDVIFNTRTGHLIDGHMRVALALDQGEPLVPVIYVDLDLEEEKIVLATLDPLSEMAGVNEDVLQSLLLNIDDYSSGIDSLIDMLHTEIDFDIDFDIESSIIEVPEIQEDATEAPQKPPASTVASMDIETRPPPVTEYICPECGHAWSGSPR